jgi:post-segregation antitoxin (ccd killing protein)
MTRTEIENSLKELIRRALVEGVRSERMHEMIADAKRQAKSEWLDENRDAITAHNERIRSQGTTLTPSWLANTDK